MWSRLFAAISRYFRSSGTRRMPRPIANLCAGAVVPVFEEEAKVIELRYIEVTSCENCPHRRHFESTHQGETRSFETCCHPRIVKKNDTPQARKLTHFPFFPDWCPLRELRQIIADRFMHKDRDADN